MSSLASWLPEWNALCNAMSLALIVLGLRAVRAKRVEAHKRLMLSSLVFSLLFLVGYLTRHALVGSTKFAGTGAWRVLYFSILTTHTILAIVNLPLVLTTATLGIRGRLDRHRKLARIAAPIWLYVSATGVLIYILLYRMFPGS